MVRAAALTSLHCHRTRPVQLEVARARRAARLHSRRGMRSTRACASGHQTTRSMRTTQGEFTIYDLGQKGSPGSLRRERFRPASTATWTSSTLLHYLHYLHYLHSSSTLLHTTPPPSSLPPPAQ
ncbi:hypothetical protein CC85DRAFT_157269 [Cutaneotrichosporon oleaginosum]|uniref:Uncharacterized protein n=1 Tax=Cutaneotrichosporon oleaginosum TaxID=879819 RepID=A0A0J0XGZ7_9TREE|nr:uncharacterized protein CC85DRAFT_157269 [Cutaneotrichosporon oleaginosum]KLT40351.1 hypothetical protein CC85DRAFT_157269 [Cutaneotrichosporon oleaginosum]TXT06484.1 hypothetical protein COLE_05815 [Cutaneotrichosporon oleaginosum]